MYVNIYIYVYVYCWCQTKHWKLFPIPNLPDIIQGPLVHSIPNDPRPPERKHLLLWQQEKARNPVVPA